MINITLSFSVVTNINSWKLKSALSNLVSLVGQLGRANQWGLANFQDGAKFARVYKASSSFVIKSVLWILNLPSYFNINIFVFHSASLSMEPSVIWTAALPVRPPLLPIIPVSSAPAFHSGAYSPSQDLFPAPPTHFLLLDKKEKQGIHIFKIGRQK